MNKQMKLSLSLLTTVALFASTALPSFAESFNQGTATWPYQTDAKCYQLFYKETTSMKWDNAVQCKDLKNPVWSYTIKYLKPGVSYVYKVREIKNTQTPNRYVWITNDMTLNTTSQQ